MSVKIRLQRHGKKGKPFYWVVAADARSKRDGKYLEKIGTYNPNTNPATIELNLDSAVQWLHNGAQPTDTAKAILSYKGALLKHHLDGGVRKGALTQEQADAKLATWLVSKAEKEVKAKALKAEKEVNAKRIAAAAQADADAIAAATQAEEVAVEEEAPAAEVEVTEETTVEEETPVAEVEVADETPTAEEVTPVAEVEVAEESTVEVVEETVAEATEETPAAEETEETPEA